MANEARAPSQDVGIVGGGPVGLLLALFLDRHGVRSVVLNDELVTRWHPRGSTHNSRTMEHYRRLGISSVVRSLGLPADHPRDVAYFTRYAGWELARIVMHSESARVRMARDAPATDQVPEPLVRANQMYVERRLLEHAGSRPNITLRFGWRAHSLQQDTTGVTVEAEDPGTRAVVRWRCAYLVGCDGGQSFVRRTLGIAYGGGRDLHEVFLSGRMVSSHVRVPALHRDILRTRKAWLYNVVSPEFRQVLISLDGADDFLLMTKAPPTSALPNDAEIADSIRRGVGADVPVSVVGSKAWTGGVALVAERFADRRVFLAGDASHLFSPTGGFGMNTGIDGAANLAWKLAAAVQGWAGTDLLASYETERRPIALRNTAAARTLTARVGALPIPRDLEEDTAAGAEARARIGVLLSGFRPQFASLGIELGARYDGSPLIHPDGRPPADDPVEYRPSGVPGGRLPHFWLLTGRDDRRRSVFDCLGVGFTLLRIGDAPAAAPFVAAAGTLRVPLSVVDLPTTPARSLLERALVLVRPDQHIAWRADEVPDDPSRILARAVGFDGSSR